MTRTARRLARLEALTTPPDLPVIAIMSNDPTDTWAQVWTLNGTPTAGSRAVREELTAEGYVIDDGRTA